MNRAIKGSDVVKEALRCAFSYEFKWHADLLYELAECTKELVTTNGQSEPSYVESVKTVLHAVGITSSNGGFRVTQRHRELSAKGYVEKITRLFRP